MSRLTGRCRGMVSQIRAQRYYYSTHLLFKTSLPQLPFVRNRIAIE